MTLKQILIPVAVVIVFGALFFFTYILNKKTPKPEGCPEISGDCKTCSNTSCDLRNKGE